MAVNARSWPSMPVNARLMPFGTRLLMFHARLLTVDATWTTMALMTLHGPQWPYGPLYPPNGPMDLCTRLMALVPA